MDEDYMYENDGFFVDVELDADSPLERDGATYSDYYIVVNKSSGIVEFKTPAIIEAISGAAMADATMKGEPWRFYSKDGGGSIEDMFAPPTNDEPSIN